jgi:DNA polymerase III delta prime subunit
VQRAYYLDRDIDKALRRMALEEGKNLTESVNDALRVGVKKYL